MEASLEGVKVPLIRMPLAWASNCGIGLGMVCLRGYGRGQEVTWTKAWVFSEYGVELSQQVAGCLHENFICRERHCGFMDLKW